MRGKRARIVRTVLPPDLRKEMKEEIRALAVARAERHRDAAREYQIGEATLRGVRNGKQNEAGREFDEKRATIVAAYEARAAERRVAAQVEEAEAATA